MFSLKHIGVMLPALLLGANAQASQPETSCKHEQPRKIVIAQPKPVEPMVQQITLYCGSQTTTQTLSSVPETKKEEREPQAKFSWDALIEAIFKFLGGIAWPIAAVCIAFSFRKELATLLTRLKKGKWGSAEVEFENYVRAVAAEADIPRSPEGENISPSAFERASKDPRGAIVSAWIEVEDALFGLVRSLGLTEEVIAWRIQT